MIVTEEEAKTKRCCGQDGCGVLTDMAYQDKRDGPIYKRRVCVGSDCMAWRWVMAADNLCGGTLRMDTKPTELVHGYCGYAGG